MKNAGAWRRWVALFEEDEDPREPRYDPIHLAAVLIGCLVVIGALYWLLWTLFVYEGGLPSKVEPLLTVLSGRATLANYGWLGTPDRQGVFEGWSANLAALLLAGGVVASLHRAYWRRGLDATRLSADASVPRARRRGRR